MESSQRIQEGGSDILLGLGTDFPKSPKVNFCIMNRKMLLAFFKDIDELNFSDLIESLKLYITSYFTKTFDDKIKLK